LINGVLISALIVLSFLVGFGVSAYGDYGFGTKSFFKASNDITLSLLLVLNISLFKFISQNKLIYILISLFILLAVILMGTRAGLIGGIGVLIIYFLFIIILRIGNKVTRKIKLLILLFVFSFSSYFASKIFSMINEYTYTMEKYEALLSETPRAKLEKAGGQVLSERSLIQIVIGKGMVPFSMGIERKYPSKKEYKYGKPAEQDLMDMIGSYGLVLGTLILFVPWIFLLKIVNRVITKKISIELAFLFLSIIIFIAHSYLAGHAINSPTVSIFIAAIYYHSYKLTINNKHAQNKKV